MRKNKWLYIKIMYLAIPVALENLVYSLINFIDIFMVGKENIALGLGSAAISSIGVSNQIFLIYSSCLYGILSGANILAAQYFGAKDFKTLRKIITITLFLGLAFSLPFIIAGNIMPEKIISFYTSDPKVISLSQKYFKIIIYTFPLHAIGFSFAMMLRSTKMPKYSLYASFCGLIVNISLNLILIPKIGVEGAAIATLVARIVTVIYILCTITYKKVPILPRISELKYISIDFVQKIIKISTLTFIHELLWSVAYSTKVMLYGKVGTTAFSSIQLVTSISGLIFTLFIGLSNATAVIIGNEIGRGHMDRAYDYSKKCLKLFGIVAIMVSVCINIFAPIILNNMGTSTQLYNVSISVIRAESIVNILKAYSIIFLIGILRAGGDIGFSLVVELAFMWLVGIPMTYFAILLKLPISIIYLISWSDELFKLYPCIKRYISKKWITNLIKE